MADTKELGLFPLEMVLLPGEPVPLHLFEPRYRELFADCILEAQPMVMLLSTGGTRAQVGCAAQVEAMTKRLADGRLNIVIRGVEPVRILDEPVIGGTLYETAVVEPLVDELEVASDALREQAKALFAQLAGSSQAPEPTPETPLSYALAGAIEMPVEPKQELLETRSEPARLQSVIELLERADQAADHARVAAERAQRNGKVSTPT